MLSCIYWGADLFIRRALLRWKLILAQVYNSGASSLIIIMLSGLFVGIVLRLQGFQPLQRFASAEALGTATAIGLVKELGLVSAFICRSRRYGADL